MSLAQSSVSLAVTYWLLTQEQKRSEKKPKFVGTFSKAGVTNVPFFSLKIHGWIVQLWADGRIICSYWASIFFFHVCCVMFESTLQLPAGVCRPS